jgi:hypothetical protein
VQNDPNASLGSFGFNNESGSLEMRRVLQGMLPGWNMNPGDQYIRGGNLDGTGLDSVVVVSHYQDDYSRYIGLLNTMNRWA